MSTTEICNLLKESRDRGYHLLKKKGLSSKKPIARILTEDEITEMKEAYLSGKTIENISSEMNIKQGTVNYWLRKLKITRPNGKVPDCDQNYFEEIDTPNKAYFLRLLYADGGFLSKPTKNGKINYILSLELKSEDSYIIEEFRKQLKSTKTVKHTQYIQHTNIKGKQYTFEKSNSYFRIGSKKLIADLIKWGCTPEKSNKIDGIPAIEDKLIRYFILGFYDGDGIASVGKSGGYIGFCGLKEMMESIENFLRKTLDIPYKPMYYNKSNKIYYLQYWNIEQVKKIFDYFYKDIEIPYLTRKKEKIEKYLNANTEVN